MTVGGDPFIISRRIGWSSPVFEAEKRYLEQSEGLCNIHFVPCCGVSKKPES